MEATTNRRLCILGATGSIGTATLAVAKRHPDWYAVHTLAAASNAGKMTQLCREWHPQRAILRDEAQAEKLHNELRGEGIEVQSGDDAITRAAQSSDSCTVVAAISGASGVESTLAAVDSGKRVLLANKESLVMAGEILMQRARANRAELLPIDSEHCSLFELLAGREDFAGCAKSAASADFAGRAKPAASADFHRLWLTASGGAVRDIPINELPQVQAQTALTHPNWSMGPKITVDSSTMMNKVLEIIEAAVLFNAAPEAIGVVMHPQSLYHALVEFPVGSLIASISKPNMEIPIAHMLRYPHNAPPSGVQAPDWQALSESSFSKPDENRYPCLRLAHEALARGGTAPAVLSAANEVAVQRFLNNDIAFTDIAKLNESILAAAPDSEASNMDTIWQADHEARTQAQAWHA